MRREKGREDGEGEKGGKIGKRKEEEGGVEMRCGGEKVRERR